MHVPADISRCSGTAVFTASLLRSEVHTLKSTACLRRLHADYRRRSLFGPGKQSRSVLSATHWAQVPTPTLSINRPFATMGEVPPEDSPFPLTDVDRWVLSQTDEEFHKHDWAELKEIVETNNLSVLKRQPSDLRRYMKWTAETKAKYGSMTQYLLVHRLPKAWGSPPFTPKSTVPFEDPSDYRVLLNDWPYGLDPEINHIVVWSRTVIATDPETGDMTPESRAVVQKFIQRYFVESLGPKGEDRILWFKNWVALQSVRSLEHIHILVRNVDDETLERWTGERPQPK
ncbi:hypothetical protein G7046_g4178 [Stylonectria norvegica]|nr:hypothetical protein G7046_g4178 [Stylonectria norvegica]